jgi:hypothetical protein
VGLRLLACWDCGFASRWGHGCLSVVSVVCCQVDVSVSGWSLVQRSPTECGVSKVCDPEASTMRWPSPPRGCQAIGKKKKKEYLCLIKQCIVKMNGGVELWLSSFLTSALNGGEWSASCLSNLTLEKTPPASIGNKAGLAAQLV